MNVQHRIESILSERLSPLHLEVVNESYMHSVPSGAESHFKVTVVTEQFTGKPLLARQRMVNDALAALLAGPVHALALHTLTPDEWFGRAGKSTDSPPCLGGSKAKR
jgi:BolA protein